jgi:hypothetical protein
MNLLCLILSNALLLSVDHNDSCSDNNEADQKKSLDIDQALSHIDLRGCRSRSDTIRTNVGEFDTRLS